MRGIGLALAALCMMAVSACAPGEPPVNSESQRGVVTPTGLQPGMLTAQFDVVDVTGPSKGKRFCYRCQYGTAPVIAAFVNGEPSRAAGLVASIQKLVEARRGKGLKTFVVFMGGPELQNPIEKLGAERKITIPLVFLPSGPSEKDIAAYQISPSAQNTIMLWTHERIRNRFENADGHRLGVVEKAVDEMLG
jgi:hypothetical protein